MDVLLVFAKTGGNARQGKARAWVHGGVASKRSFGLWYEGCLMIVRASAGVEGS